MKLFLRSAFAGLLLMLVNPSKAQTITGVDIDTILQENYTLIQVYSTGLDQTMGTATSAMLINATDTIISDYISPYNSDTAQYEFYPSCSVNAGGWYDLYVTDGTNTAMLPNAVFVHVDLGLYFDLYNITCHGAHDGELYINTGGQGLRANDPSRGGPMWWYIWNPLSGSDSSSYYISSLGPGTYWCTVIDQYTGCRDSISTTLIDPPVMNVYWTKVDADCGMQNGYAFIDSITGGVPFTSGPAYELYWYPSEASTDSILNLPPGDYGFYVNDSFYCNYSVDFSILEALTLDFTTVSTACGDPSGSATVTPVNGVAPFTILWSNGDTGFTADSLQPGIYTIDVSDANSCYGTGIATVTGTDAPSITSVITGSPSCSGLNNGSIDITVSGGTAPYSYLWSNGATTEDISNVPAGVYEVTVTDATGCYSSLCISIVEQTQLSIDWVDVYGSYCGFNDGEADSYVSGGTPPYTYQWDANAGNATTSWVYPLAPGNYQLIVTDAIGCQDSTIVSVSDWNGPYFNYDSTTAAHCGSMNGAVYITPLAGSGAGGPFTVSWSDGSSNEDLTGVDPGTYYVTVTDVNGCINNGSVWVDGDSVAGQDICIVTVDSLTQSNLVAWEKAIVADIDYYNIYREACGNIEGLVWVGAVDYDSLSQFIDYGANPMVKSWRYVMTAVNNCGVESDVSPMHKTIHLTANRQLTNNVLVTWDNYTGFTYTDQYLWRYHTSTNWQIIDTLAYGINQYLDTSSLAIDSVLYFIEVYPGYTCTSTRAENHNSTRSNRGSIAAPSDDNVADNDFVMLMNVYPNPSTGTFNLNFVVDKPTQTNLVLYDLSGRIIMNKPLNVSSGFNNYSLQLEGISDGIYYLQMRAGETLYKAKIIKQ